MIPVLVFTGISFGVWQYERSQTEQRLQSDSDLVQKQVNLHKAELYQSQQALKCALEEPSNVEDKLAGTLEEERVLAEEGRMETENMRVLNELKRVSNAIDSMVKEQQRVKGEQQRVAGEVDRVTKDGKRQRDSHAMVVEEQKRVAAAVKFMKSEQQRIAAEQERVRAEMLRIEREEEMQHTFRDSMLAEQKRLEAVVVGNEEIKNQEAKRIEQEILRQSNENLRMEKDLFVANENLTQLSNEMGRIKAEKKREKKFAEIQAQSKSLSSAQKMKGVATHIDELKKELKHAELREKERMNQLWPSFANGNGKAQN